MPPPQILARLKAEKADRQYTASLNKDAYAQGRISVCRMLGIHQIPPMTCRSCCYMLYDCFGEIWFQSKRIIWYFIALITCGKIVRHRRPKVHVMIEVLEAPSNKATLGITNDTEHPQIEECKR
mmetsp:Transcript_29476/g.34698  ORF Transcript_29476/g.34698 Transcript_29476/m.34698 type:complete len:124 (-) Transcript_29476:88-459(-)